MPADELELAKRERKSAKGKFTRAYNGLKNALELEAPMKTVDKRMTELIEVWNDVQEKHDRYTLLLEDADDEKEEEWIQELRERDPKKSLNLTLQSRA